MPWILHDVKYMIVQWMSYQCLFVLEPATLFQLLYPYPVGEHIEMVGVGSVGPSVMQSATCS